MATGTLSPEAKQYFWDTTTGEPLAGGFVYTVTAGGSYPADAVATYTTDALTTANDNPIELNSAGYCVIYLRPGVTYKYIVHDADDVLQWTQDGIQAVPGSASSVDVIVTAGENIAAEASVYISDGSGGKNAGQAYNADADFAYASTDAGTVGLAIAAILSGDQGSIRIIGPLDVSQSLTPGASYYVSGTAGAITNTAPANARYVGQADSASSIVIASTPAVPIPDAGICEGRLTLTTGVPITTADVVNATTIYFTPYLGNRIAIYDGAKWAVRTFSERSVALGTLTTTLPYDVFIYNNGGTLTLEVLAWTNTTTRATALVNQDGVPSKTGALTRRYLGTFYTTSTTQTQDTATQRFLWNYYNRVPRSFVQNDTTASWIYSTATWRQQRATATNQVELVQGVAESLLTLTTRVVVGNDTGGAVIANLAIGEDSTTTPTGAANVGAVSLTTANQYMPMSAELAKVPAVGYHKYVILEGVTATGATTWVGASSTTVATVLAAGTGIFGWITN